MTHADFVAGNHTDKYGTKNPISRYLMSGFLQSAQDLFNRTGATRILEVGCGEGELGARLMQDSSGDYLGTDLSAEIVEEAQRRHPHLRFQAVGAESVPFPDSSFDLVVACEVLEHVEDPEVVLQEIVRLSSSWVLVSVPREPLWRCLNMVRGAYWNDLGNTPGHIQHWGTNGFIKLLRRHLRVVEIRTPLPWTMALCQIHPSSQ